MVFGDFHLKRSRFARCQRADCRHRDVDREGARAGIVHDLGQVTGTISKALDGSTFWSSRRITTRACWAVPPVAGEDPRRFGHLSNHDAGILAGHSIHSGLNNIVLAHLSEQNNTPRTALATVGDSLRRGRFRGRLTAASQDHVVGPICVTHNGATSSLAPVQLALGL